MEPKISIIMPVYNSEGYLKKSIQSVMQQTIKELELIIVDDGSTDQSGKLCDDYKNKYPNILVIHQKNTGVSSARNMGINVAKGKYIGFVDADDTIDPNMFSFLYQLAEKYNCDLVASRYCNFYGKNFQKKMPDTIGIDLIDCPVTGKDIQKNILPAVYGGFDCSVWNKLFKREIIKNQNILFPNNVFIGEDYLFVLKYFLYVKTYYYTTSILYNYYVRECSAMRSYCSGYMDNYFYIYDEKNRLISNFYNNDKILVEKNKLWYWNWGKIFLGNTVNRKEKDILQMRNMVKKKIIYPNIGFRVKMKFKKYLKF